MINGRNFFDQPIKNDLKTYDNIRKTATGQCEVKIRARLYGRMFNRLSFF